jgi:hypothetical protein
MREVSCGSMPAIVNCLLFIYLWFFSVYSGSMGEASCGSMMPAFIVYYLFTT